MNGFLSAEGVFYECGFMEHSKLAQKLVHENKYYVDVFDPQWSDNEHVLKKNGYIYFGYTGDLGTNTDSYVFLDFDDMNITDKQYEWVEENKDKLQEKQLLYFYKYYEKVKGE